jgi:hypothetical protein
MDPKDILDKLAQHTEAVEQTPESAEKLARVFTAFWDAVEAETEKEEWKTDEVGGLGLMVLGSLMDASDIDMQTWTMNIAGMCLRRSQELNEDVEEARTATKH